MAEQVGEIYYSLGLDDSGFNKKLKQASGNLDGLSKKFSSVGDSMTNLGKKMTVGFTLPIVAGAALSIKKASDLNETINKVDVAFKENAKEVKEWSKTTIKNFGIAGSTAMEMASLFGDMSTSMGLNTAEAAKMSMSLAGLAGDLASFKNINIEEAQTALAGVFTGETESLKRLGIVMTETNLLEYAKAKGIKKTVQEMTQAEKVQLRYQYIMEMTKNSQGDFNRTSEGTANQMRMVGERFKELQETIGAYLLPYVNKLMGYLTDLMARFKALTPTQQKAILAFLGILAVLGPLLIILGSIISAIGSIGAALAASTPTFWIFIAVAVALAGAAYLIYKNWDSIKPVVDAVVEKLKIAYAWFSTYILPVLKVVAGFIKDQLVAAFNQLKMAWDTLVKAITPYLPQLQMLGKILLGISLMITGFLIVSIVGFITVLSVVIRAIATVINWLVKLSVEFTRLQQAVWNAMVGVKNAIVNIFIGAASWLYNAGKEIMNGLIKGIKDKVNEVSNAVKSVTSTITGKVKGILGINSPSKVFYGFGENITQGLTNGINNGIGKVSDMANNMAVKVQAPTVNAESLKQPAMGGGLTHYGDIIINDRQDATAIMQILGRQQELSNYGMAR